MKCGTCGLELSAGAVHVSGEGCIEALREALNAAAICCECSAPLLRPMHPACVAKAAARRGSSLVIDESCRRAVEGMARFFGKKD